MAPSGGPESANSSRPPSEKSDTGTPPIPPPTPTANLGKNPDDSSKLRLFLSILKRFIGVADMSAIRFSLPAQLMEPIPNLEYWQYLDCPETYASIADSDDPLGRMLGVLRFWFTKDLKYVKGKPCKPYNSVLGEFFRCSWKIDAPLPPLIGSAPEQNGESKPLQVLYLTEQTSHHPPVSAYYIDCPERGISGRGFDQLSANFTGTRIRVSPGNYNLGIFLTLHKWDDESYHLTHPTANLGGLLRGSLSVSVSDSCSITCPKTRLKALLTYQEDGWLSRGQNLMQGIIFNYDPDNDTVTKLKEVPNADIVARVEGSWQEKIYFTLGNKSFDKSDKTLLVDLEPLWPAKKTVPADEDQLPNESRKFWSSLTDAIVNKQWGQASQLKQSIEERQRQKAADRKSRNVEWKPRFFTESVGPPGRPELSQEGVEAFAKMGKGDYHLEPSPELAS